MSELVGRLLVGGRLVPGTLRHARGRIESVALRASRQQFLMCMLPVNVDEICSHLRKICHCDRSIIDVCATAAIDGNNATENDFFVYSISLYVKHRFDSRLLRPCTDN